jgi:hypothetical protein
VGGEAGGVGDVSPGSLDLDIRHDGGKRKTNTKKKEEEEEEAEAAASQPNHEK